jgi:hypothetical protein
MGSGVMRAPSYPSLQQPNESVTAEANVGDEVGRGRRQQGTDVTLVNKSGRLVSAADVL